MLLKRLEEEGAVAAKQGQVETKGAISKGCQSPKPLPEQNGGSPEVAPFPMKVGDGNLEDALEHRTIGLQGFVPERLKAIVASIPVGLIE